MQKIFPIHSRKAKKGVKKMNMEKKTQEPEQLLFSFNDAFEGEVPTSAAQVVNHHRTAPVVKGTVPEQYKKLNGLTLEQFMHRINANLIYERKRYRSAPMRPDGNRVLLTNIDADDKVIYVTRDQGCKVCLSATALYVDRTGGFWKADMKIELDREVQQGMAQYANHTAYCENYTIGEWALVKNPRLMPTYFFVQTEEELLGILRDINPFAALWVEDKHEADVRCCLLAPHIEILCKAGYSFAYLFTDYTRMKEQDCVIFNRLCQRGSKPKDIFKTDKVVYSVLKYETNMAIWDGFRKLKKCAKIGADAIQQAYDNGYDQRDLECFNSILAKRYDGKPVFTWNSLMQYLVRLDTFEAIGRKEAFILLDDYLSMCSQLHMAPRIDGDSLKREHDIAARNCRNRRNELIAAGMKNTCEKMKAYDYTEGIYFVRAIRDQDDLLDEANQQHNCVASYGSNIANGKSYIYVMREVARPDKSLITIELSPNGKTIRQKFLAYNQAIHNKSQSDFIERWLRYVRSVG